MSQDTTENKSGNLAEILNTGPNCIVPEDAPFNDEQKQWLNGLITGIKLMVDAAGKKPEEIPGTPMTILYGSQSGNSETLSKDLRKFAKTQGFDAQVLELDSFDKSTLPEIQHLAIICSTFGEGEPPDNARSFYEWILSDDAPSLPATLNYSVCGLGDSSYADFNQAAADIDQKLEALGANRIADLIACDVDFEDDYASWKTGLFETPQFKDAAGASSAPVAEEDDSSSKYDKSTPFLASMLAAENLSAAKSAKEVNHIEISLAGGGEDMHYDVGDALGVWPVNDLQDVKRLLDALPEVTGNETVSLKAGDMALRTALLTKLDLSTVNANTLETWGVEADLEALQPCHAIDILTTYKPKLDAQKFVSGLRALQPRLYSIASSPKAHPGEVHLTVGAVKYSLNDTERQGVASTFLGERCSIGSSVGVYIQRSAHFHLPSDDNARLIMVGPGTGIAPFRAFLEERDARDAKGENWLFFGDQHEASDFLYKDQLTELQTKGVLSKLSLAWSRDGAEKVYVQNKMQEAAAEFFEWLESGAYIYICGDASRMAKDVDSTLRTIIGEQGKLDETGVQAYMDKLVAEHRYQRDVY